MSDFKRQKANSNRAVFRYTALAGACALAFGSYTANAQTTTYTITTPSVQTPGGAGPLAQYVQNVQSAQGAQYSSIVNSGGFVTANSTSLVGTPTTVNANTSIASTIGNLADPNQIDLFLAQSVLGTVGILSGQSRATVGGAPVVSSSAQSGMLFGVRESNQAPAVKTVNGNTVLSETQLNDATNVIAGKLTNNLNSNTAASATQTFNAGVGTSSATGAVSINSNQSSFNAGGRAGSIATVDTTTVTLDQSAITGGTASAALTLKDNTIATTYGGNSATNAFRADAGGATLLHGGVTVTNAQINVETQGPGAVQTSLITTSQINADIRSRVAGSPTTLAAPLVVTGNTLSASSTGNSAGARTADGIAAGNSIVLAQGIDVTGNNATGLALTLAPAGTPQVQMATGDLVVSSQQVNQGTYFNSQVQGSATTPLQGGVVTTRADQIGAGGSITLGSNTVEAQSTGNLAGNLVRADNANTTAVATSNNAQLNTATPINATVNFGSVTSNVGSANAPVSGTVGVNDNTVAASADGNVAVSTVDLKSTNLTALRGGGNPSVSGANATTGVLVASGANVGNVQSNTGGAAIDATVYSSYVAANFRDQQTLGNPLVGVSGATVNVNGNDITSTASGNAAGNTVKLSGSNGTVQAGVGSMQNNTSSVSARVLESGVTLNAANATGSTLVLSSNNVASGATGNQAVNSASATGFATLTTGANPVTAAGASTAAMQAQSTAALAVANSQQNTGSISSLTQNTAAGGAGGGFATVYAGTAAGGVTGGTLTVSGNTVSATTQGNVAGNTATIGGATVQTLAGAATSIAAISSIQSNNVAGVANATVDGGSAATTSVGASLAGAISGTPLTVSTNTVTAATIGNDATNTITGSGGALSSATPLVASGVANGATGAVSNEFSLANLQTDTATGGRAALVQLVTAGVTNTSASTVTGSAITVNTNQVLAEARNNDAANKIDLNGFSSLDSGAGVLNSQSSATAVSSTVAGSTVHIQLTGGVVPATITGSNLTMDSNAVKSTAVGSSATNELKAGGATVTGNANNASSGVAFGLGTVTTTADYGIANQQTQTGSVTATTAGSVRMVMAPVGGPGSATVTGGTATMAKNTVSAVAQGTSATSTSTVKATGGATGLTAAIGSNQTTNAAVSATVGAEAGTTYGVVTLEATSFTNTPVTMSGNRVAAAAGQNEAFNTQSVGGSLVSGKALAASTDFLVANQQGATGNVTATNNGGTNGVFTNAVDGGSVTVTGNQSTASANANTGTNGLTLSATGSLAGSGGVLNNQTANSGVVSATLGALAPAGVGIAAAVPGATPTFSGTSATVTGNTLSATASRNSADNTLAASGATIAAGTGNTGGLTQGLAVSNTQAGTGNTTATATIGTIGSPVHLSLGTNLTVGGNLANAAANTNLANNAMTVAGTSSFSGAAVVSNSQSSGTLGADVVSATMNAGTVGLAPAASGLSMFSGGTIAVASNNVVAQAGRNSASNTLSATAVTLSGSAASPASFTAQNGQTAVGDVTASNTVGTVGATANTATANTFTITGNAVRAQAGSNAADTIVTLASAGVLSGTAMADNTQTANGGTVSANVTTSLVGVRGVALDSTPVTVSGNTLDAQATRNNAVSAVTANAVTIAGAANAPASFSVRSLQNGNGNVTSTNTVGFIGATQNNAFGLGSFGVIDNKVISYANVNKASNSLVLNAASAFGGTGQVSNTQNSGTVGPATAVNASATGGTIGVAAFTSGNTITGQPVTVSGNSIAAQGGGNTALNALEATATSSFAPSGFPTFGVLNGQTNAATVTTTVTNFNVGLGVSTATNTATSVVSNQASALGYGNTATNSLAMSALNGTSNMASAMIGNTQTNTAAINSMVSGVNMGVVAGSMSGGSAVVSNNTISARSVGNSASNVISAK